ncbi:MAG: hypothetical protein ACRC33_08245 [Gemmataceae bacterium]
MKNLLRAAVLAAVATTSAFAQAPLRPGIGPNTRPAFSPYLNLVRNGNSAAFNYFGLVRPELQFRDSIQSLQGDVATNRQMINATNATVASALPATGHTATFLNTGGYFLNSAGGGGSRGSAAAPSRAGGATPARGGARGR